jgi:hypothetical protein
MACSHSADRDGSAMCNRYANCTITILISDESLALKFLPCYSYELERDSDGAAQTARASSAV